MGRRRLVTLLAATLASGMIALPASALSLGEVADGASLSTVTQAVDEALDAAEPVIEATSAIIEATGLDEVVSPDDVVDGVADQLAPVTDLFSEGKPAPQDEQNGPAPAPSSTPLPASTRPADDVVAAAGPASDSSSSSVRPAPLPGDGSSAPAAAPRAESPPAAQVAPPAPIAAPRLDTAPATRAPDLAVPVSESVADAWLKVIASLMVLGTAGIWYRANDNTI